MNFKKVLTLGALLVVLTMALTLSALSQVYVSATNGDDTFGAGTIGAPYRSITKAMAVAPTGSTISVEAGIYNSVVIPTEANPITLATARTFTFVGTSVGVNTTVTLTNGFTLANASAAVDFGSTGTAKFNFGTTATALVLTAGSMTSSTPANVVIGSAAGATITFTAGTLSFIPTTGSNLSVIFNGTGAISSTAAFLPSSYGTGTLTFNKGTGDIIVDNASLSATSITSSNVTNPTINGNVTIAAAGNITNSGTGTLTIGASSANTLTMSATTAGVPATITTSSSGTTVVNSTLGYSVKNAGTDATLGDAAALTVGNVVAMTGSSNVTLNGNVTFNNTNIPSPDGKNAVRHNVTISNGGTGALSIVGSIATPLSGATFSNPTGGNDFAFIDVILSNTAAGSFATRAAATRGVVATPGVINSGGGAMTLGQSGDTFTTTYAVVNGSGAGTEVLTVNATGVFGGAFTNSGAAGVKTVFGASCSVAGIFTNAATNNVQLNANVLTVSKTGAGAVNNAGDIYSASSGVTGSGLLKLTGAAPTMLGTGKLPNVEFANATSASTVGNVVWGNLTHSAAGTLTIGASSDIKGNLVLSGAGLTTINDAGAVSSIVRGTTTMTSGSLTLGTAGLIQYGTFNMSAGTLTFGANTLDLKGDFNRTAGTIDATAAGTGTLQFSGSAPQNFTPGTQMNVFNVIVNNTGTYVLNVVSNDIITVNASLIVLRDFTITTGHVSLGLNNIRMEQAALGVPIKSARFTNGGRGYDATGVGGIIFEGDGTNAAGAGDGAVMTGAQPFSNVFIRLSVAANNVYCLAGVVISGVVTFDGGGLTWDQPNDAGDLFLASTLTLDNSLVIPTVVINTVNAHGSPYMFPGGAVALVITTVYNLTYTGSTAVTMGATDFIAGSVNNLSLVQGTGKIIQFIAGNGTIKGSLSIDPLETLNLANGGARTLTASSNTATHVVNGTVSGGTFEVTGTGASLTGGSGTGNVSSIATLLLDPATAGTFSSTGMKVLTNLTVNQTALVSTIAMNGASATVGTFLNTAGTTNLNMNATASSITANFTVAAGAVTLTMNGGAAGTRTIGGALAVNGGSLTLGSHIDVTGAASQAAAGSIVLGASNLTLGGTYGHAGTGTVTGTGAVVAKATPVAQVVYTLTTAVTFPNFTLNYSAFGIQLNTAGMTVAGKFTHTAGDFDFNSLGLTIGGDYSYAAGTYTNSGVAITGVMTFTGTAATATLAANPTIPYVTVNTTGSWTLATNDNTTPTARSLNVSGAFTLTAGTLNLGINDITITNIGAADGSFTYTAGTINATSTGANIGELVFNGVNSNGVLNQNTGFVIPNLTITSSASLGQAKTFTVTNNLTFTGSFATGADARMILSDGATITRNATAGTLSNLPAFGTTVNVTYGGVVNPTGLELPTSTTALIDLTIGANVTLGAPATVNGHLYLNAGTLTTSASNFITMASGSTLVKTGGAALTAAVTVATGSLLNLEYAGTTATDNFTWPATATIGSVKFSGAGTKTLHAARTTTGPLSFTGGTFDLNAFNFTVQGDVTFTGSAAITNGGATTSEWIFNGPANEAFTTVAGFVVPAFVNVRLNMQTATGAVNVTGGNMNLSTWASTLYLDKGVLSMASGTALILRKPTTTVIYYTRTLGMVAGMVQYAITAGDGNAGSNGRFEFPVGTVAGLYRPVAITFTPSYPAQNPTNLQVTAVEGSPQGTVGFPFDGGNGVQIGNYPNYYWLVGATTSFSQTQAFDVELTGTNFGIPFLNVNDLRITKRVDANANFNPWQLQGVGSSYTSNFMNIVGTDSIITVRSTSSTGGLVVQGTRFTIGIPVRPPLWSAEDLTVSPHVNALVDTMDVGMTHTLKMDAIGQNITPGVTTYAIVSGPAYATIVATTGVVTLHPTTNAQAGPAALTVSATDIGGTIQRVTNLYVWIVNNAPVFTPKTYTATGVTDKVALSYAMKATHADSATQTLTYSYLSISPAPAVVTNLPTVTGSTLSWAPTFADAAKTFTIKALVSDGVLSGHGPVPGTDTLTVTVTVNRSRALGDVDGNGLVQALDASPILKYVVGLPTAPVDFTDPATFYAADVSHNGSVGAYDASLILQAAAGLYTITGANGDATLAKSDAMQATGALAMGSPEATTSPEVVKVGIKLSNPANVYSVALTSKADFSQVSIDAVNATLPEGWNMQWNVVGGELRIVAAGITPLPAGDVASIMVHLKSKESRLSFTSDAMLNENSQSLGTVEVAAIPTVFALELNYPNPFNPSTTIRYQIATDASVNLVIYNVQGQKIRTLVSTEQKAGYYNVVWDGRNEAGQTVSSGLYLYRVQAGSFVATHKMMMLK